MFSRNPQGKVRQGKGCPLNSPPAGSTWSREAVKGSTLALLFFSFCFSSFLNQKKPIKYQRRTTRRQWASLSLAYHVEGRSGSEMRRGRKIATKPTPVPTTKMRPSDSLKKKSSRRCERQLLIPCDARFDPGTATTGALVVMVAAWGGFGEGKSLFPGRNGRPPGAESAPSVDHDSQR